MFFVRYNSCYLHGALQPDSRQYRVILYSIIIFFWTKNSGWQKIFLLERTDWKISLYDSFIAASLLRTSFLLNDIWFVCFSLRISIQQNFLIILIIELNLKFQKANELLAIFLMKDNEVLIYSMFTKIHPTSDDH